jgi:peptide-methionine (S)-S-oxide reductase
MAKEIATLGGGCFWCIEAVYNQLKGVNSALSGYAGGHVINPTYREVCNITTGHAEVVQVEFDNDVVSFGQILDIFFTIHDPTTLNRQGNDVGPQYRSLVLYHNDEQKRVAEAKIKEFSEVWSDPIVTEVKAFDTFYVAEAEHQEFFANNPTWPYCQIVVAPKVAKFRKKFFDQLKAEVV